jgi:TonB family protein
MLVLALVAWLAAPAPEVTRIPGTKLHLGMTEGQLLAMGAFPEVHARDAVGATSRQGSVKFFGIACQATLYLRDGFLARAHFEAAGVSPNTQDYVEDQLRRAKLLRECTRFAPGDHACDWLGAVKIHLEIQKDRVDARIDPPARPWEAEPEAPPSTTAATETAPPAAASTPATPAPSPGPAATGAAPSTSGAAAPPPASGTNPAPAGSTPSPAGATPAPAPAAPSAPAVAPERAAEPVATLPETLRLSLPERNAPGEWPRMTTVPKLVYPEAARRESVQGIVWVLALVDTDGSVKNTSIDRGIRELNDAAVAWVSKARFAPCVKDGHPCRFWVRVAARFTLY